MKFILILTCCFAFSLPAAAQDSATVAEKERFAEKLEKYDITLSADFVSQYIWRGLDLGIVALQPTFSVGVKGLTFGAWGSVGLTDPADTRELDLNLSYSIKGFNIGVTDYWLSNGADPRGRYFAYKNNRTNHVFEANIGYDFDVLSVQWYTNFAGNDGLNKDGKRAYSSYLELSAPFRVIGVDWNAAVGVVPYGTTFYGTSKFAVTNLSLRATKEIKVTRTFGIPLFAQVIANPQSKKAYFVFGFTLQP